MRSEGEVESDEVPVNEQEGDKGRGEGDAATVKRKDGAKEGCGA